jgi:tetratricopeptide (TPR) repeat protein
MKELQEKTKDKVVDLVRNSSFDEAEKICIQALKVFDEICFSQYLGICYLGLKKYIEAKEIFEKNIKRSNLAEDYNNFGIALRFLKDYEKSYMAGKKAIELCESNPSFFANLATTAKLLNKDEEALYLITMALTMSPNNNALWFDKGALHFSVGDLHNAEKCYRSGLKIPPLNENYCVELFYVMALQNKYPEAWKFYEFRYNTISQVNKIINASKLDVLLEKKDFYNEKICISFEQGYGDNLMFLRFLPEFQKKARNSYLLLQDNNLKEYVKKINVKYKKSIKKDTEKIICLMSLPYHLDVEKIPPPICIKEHKPTKSHPIKIGLCWAGSALHPMDYQRSTYLKWYSKFFSDKKIKLYSFVKDRRPRIHKENQEIVDFAEGFNDLEIEDMSNNLNSVQDSMDALQNIDVLVTVDTFMAHIAGTMGVPTYLILSKIPDWRWGKTGNSTAWYPSFKIFRQEENTLEDVINEVYEKIRSDHIAPYSER